MNEQAPREDVADPTTQPFWDACRARRFVIQRCEDCGHHQFYPRPLCLRCESPRVGWVAAKGTGTIYSITTVRVPVMDALPPPYRVALIALDEGPRYLANVEGAEARIGDRVSLDWRERGSLPPLPVFRLAGDGRRDRPHG